VGRYQSRLFSTALVAHSTRIANCSISRWRRTDGELRPELFNFVEHLHREGIPPTRQEDVNAEPV
jgi:probable phosphoglycerate mutase